MTSTSSAGEIARFSSSAASGEVNLSVGFTSTNQFKIGYDIASGNGILETNVNNSSIIFRGDGAQERVRIDGSGRLGLGTSSVSAKLHITSSSGGDDSGLRITRSDAGGGDWRIWSTADVNGEGGGKLIIGNASNRVTIDDQGRLGIGTTAVNTWKFHVATADQYVATLYQSGGSSHGNKDATVAFTDGTYYNNANDWAHTHRWNVNGGGTEAARIDSSGRLLVGTSSTSGDTRAIFQGSSLNNWAVVRMCANTTSPADLGYLVFGDSNHVNAAWINAAKDGGTWTSGSSHPTRLVFSTCPDGASSPTERMRILSNGNTLIGTTTDSAGVRLTVSGGIIKCQNIYDNTTAVAANVNIDSNGNLARSTSSLKYKKNVENAKHGLAELLQLRPVTYQSKNQNDGNQLYGGLIAEEVDAVGLPEFVQYAEDGTPDALAYGNMVSLCIKAIQEQQTMIAQLQTEVAALKAS
jgi:hypothetical protein